MTGSGTLLDPYVIYDVNDLQAMENDLAAYYELGQDIDASATSGWNWNAGRGVFEGFKPIGDYYNPFTGSLDGKNFKITGLFINREPFKYTDGPVTGWTPIGLFGAMHGTVNNLGLEAVDITSHKVGNRAYAASLVGQLQGIVDNCYATGSVKAEATGERATASGFVLENCAGVITNSHSTCTVHAKVGTERASASGFCHLVYNPEADPQSGEISNCYATGNVSAEGGTGRVSASGFLNVMYAESKISKCYAIGNVTVYSSSGRNVSASGFCEVSYGNSLIRRCFSTGNVTAEGDEAESAGFIATHYDAIIEDCYARGNASAIANAGDAFASGFVNYNGAGGIVRRCYSTGVLTATASGTSFLGGFCECNTGTITDCFWDTETSGQATSDGGTGKTTAQMKTAATFTDAGWDLATIWTICGGVNNDYPCLLGVTPSCVLAPVIPFVINKAYALAREEL